MKGKCIKCGAVLSDGAVFCTNCGTPVDTSQNNQPSKLASVTANVINKASNSNINASKFAGETALGGSGIIGGSNILSTLNPIKLIISEAIRYIRSIISSFKDIKKLIPAIVLAVVWVVLLLLPRLGLNPLPVQILSFITFTQGGISNNVFRMLGGIVGKGLFAYLVTAIVTPLFRGQNPFKTIVGGFKSTIDSYKNIASNIAPLLAGASAALIFYNFMAGYASLWKSMAAVTAVFLTLRATGSNGFVTRLLNSLFNRKSNKIDVRSIIAGMSAGFMLAIPLSAIPFVYICYSLGAFMMITAVVLLVVNQSKKGAAK
ncbi:MAG: hypothetical protein A2Y17_01015 [Clostridiales bacterium GWF2_38_85]|nr:MAG: hypothetical protein A2Y17_01015 [Clostridiales bacterium GWF2_38_85]HBL84531.1 hypothetical protein [Clostridiales bacterium]